MKNHLLKATGVKQFTSLLLVLSLGLVSCATDYSVAPLSACPEPEPVVSQSCPELPVNSAKTQGDASTDMLDGKQIIGQVEYALVSPPDLRLRARIDSGATTTSVHATSIEPFERDGEDWVRFEMVNPETEVYLPVEGKITRIASIKRHGAEDVKRPVVRLKVSIGSVSLPIEVTLADRSSFEYPVLIGRNFLQGTSVVDVSGEYLADKSAN